jgi:hypothetical protein
LDKVVLKVRRVLTIYYLCTYELVELGTDVAVGGVAELVDASFDFVGVTGSGMMVSGNVRV